VQRPPYSAATRSEPRETQARGLLRHHRSLLDLGADITAAARIAAALHMADAAPHAQNPRDQAARLRELVASFTQEAAK